MIILGRGRAAVNDHGPHFVIQTSDIYARARRGAAAWFGAKIDNRSVFGGLDAVLKDLVKIR